ncbi:unnamed protein product [Lupinus luteus]|uniref:Uncharacterized protein n=1 Tax=Lupinus luteus TaxID=3873 RepID=A0AAV1YM34_LUPLU
MVKVKIQTETLMKVKSVDSKVEMVGENTLLDQKSHHRCRRRKHDYRMVVDALR